MSETPETRSREELERVIETRSEQVRETIADAEHERRDLSDVESEAVKSYKAEVDDAKSELRTVEARERAQMAQRELSRMRSEPDPSEASLGEFERLLTNRTAGRVELRAATTSTAGARTEVAGATGRPQYLAQAAGIAQQQATSLRVETPYFAELAVQSSTGEGSTKPVMTDPTLQTGTLEAFAITQEVSDQLIRFGVGLNVIGQRLQAEVVYSVNAATATTFSDEAGTPLTFTESASHMLDLGIATVQERTGNFPSLIVLNPQDYPMIANKMGADSGSDIGSRVATFNGVRLAANATQSAGAATVVDGAGWSSFGTGLMLDSLPDLTTNMVTARAEQYFLVMPHYAGSAVAVSLSSS